MLDELVNVSIRYSAFSNDVLPQTFVEITFTSYSLNKVTFIEHCFIEYIEDSLINRRSKRLHQVIHKWLSSLTGGM